MSVFSASCFLLRAVCAAQSLKRSLFCFKQIEMSHQGSDTKPQGCVQAACRAGPELLWSTGCAGRHVRAEAGALKAICFNRTEVKSPGAGGDRTATPV